jgi:hypothetical protein
MITLCLYLLRQCFKLVAKQLDGIPEGIKPEDPKSALMVRTLYDSLCQLNDTLLQYKQGWQKKEANGKILFQNAPRHLRGR